MCKSNANTCRRNSTKFLAFQRILDRNETSTKFLRIFEAWIELSVTYSLMALMQLKLSSETSFYAANIWGDNSLQLFILSKRFGWICGSVLLYVRLPWNFPQQFESRDLCCLQPWQHSVYQLCWCVWDHLSTLLLVVIVAKVSNYSTKKQKSPSTSKASTQLKYRKRWNATGY